VAASSPIAGLGMGPTAWALNLGDITSTEDLKARMGRLDAFVSRRTNA
jgi:hypothetical protein